MTVTIRPVPSRVAGNRIVPFGRVQNTYRPNPVGLRDWKPPVPEPLRPAPLLGLGTLAALGLQALAYAWGQLNSRPQQTTTITPVPGMQAAGTIPAEGNTVPGTLSITFGPGSYQAYKQNCTPDGSPTVVSTSGTDIRTNVIGASFESVAGSCGQAQLLIRLKRSGQSDQLINLITTSFGIVSYSRPIAFDFSGTNKQNFSFPTEAQPLPNGFVVPQIEPETETAPARTAPAPPPLPLPSTVPQVVPSTEPDALPAPSPLVPITPGPVAPPAIRPATPISPQQPKAPAPTATNNGNVIAPAPVPVPTTPQDAIFPVPGGLPVTGRTMKPTIEAVAQEVGRIEQKIDRMLNPDQGGWGDATDRLQLLWQLLNQLYNALTDGAPAGAYELSSPCVTDANGDRIIYETQWPEQGTNHGAILARVDAIAALLQVHKDLKQPNCHIPPVAVGGEFVTVNFEQID